MVQNCYKCNYLCVEGVERELGLLACMMECCPNKTLLGKKIHSLQFYVYLKKQNHTSHGPTIHAVIGIKKYCILHYCLLAARVAITQA